jgi:hypothetical protein
MLRSPVPSDPAALLEALWEAHVGRAQLQAELDRQAAANGRGGVSGSRPVAASQLEIGTTHLERVIHWTLDEFEKRAATDTATREFVSSEAARQVMATKIDRDMPRPQPPRGTLHPRLFYTLAAQRSQQIAHLVHVANAQLQVMANSYAGPPPEPPKELVSIEKGGAPTMTREELEKRDELRLLVLRTIFDASKGSTHSADHLS